LEDPVGSALADGKAAPHPGAASKTQLKKKLLRASQATPKPEHLPDTHPLPDRSPWLPKNANGTHSVQ